MKKGSLKIIPSLNILPQIDSNISSPMKSTFENSKWSHIESAVKLEINKKETLGTTKNYV